MKPILHSGPGLLIGLPTLGRPVPLEWAFAFKSLNPPINYNVMFQIIKGAEVAEARNQMAQTAIEKGAKYLFFLGDDVEVPNHTLRNLIYRMEQDPKLGVVGGVYCAKADPPFPLVFRGNGHGAFWDWRIPEFFEVTGMGMDCTLIRTEVFKDIEYPYFKTVKEDDYLDGVNSAEEWTEDLYFFNKLNQLNKWKVMIDGGVICKHHDVYGGRVYELPLDSIPMHQRVITKDKRALIVGEPININEPDQFDVVTFGDEGSDFRGHSSMLPFEKDEFDWSILTNYAPRANNANAMIELLRVTKPGGKVTVHFTDFIDVNRVSAHWAAAQFGVDFKVVNEAILEFRKAS